MKLYYKKNERAPNYREEGKSARTTTEDNNPFVKEGKIVLGS